MMLMKSVHHPNRISHAEHNWLETCATSKGAKGHAGIAVGRTKVWVEKQNSGGHMTAASEGIDISDLIVRINFVPRRDDVTADRAEFGQGFVVMEFDVA